MEVRPGYKRTAVGIIPDDWDVHLLRQVTLDMLQGVNTAIDKPEYVLDGVPMLKANNVIDGEVLFDGADHISTTTFSRYSDRFKAKKDDFLFSNIGARLGTGSLLKHEIECSFAWNVMRIIPNKLRITPEYLAFLINSPKCSQEVRSYQSGSGMGFVPKGVMQNLAIALPKRLDEQRSIAMALSDVDALLGALDRLIAKKRDLKQAAMQQLLTGQTRLPSFHGQWQARRLGDLILRLRKTNRPSAEGQADGAYPFFTNSTKACDKFLDESDFDTEAVIANTGGEAYFNYCHGPFAAMADCLVFESLVVTRYLFFVLKSMERQINEVAFTGSGIKHLDKKYFADFQLRLPREPAEQTAIAKVLSDMDAEIAALEQRREKTRALKQGMMQELLTGKTRLVDPSGTTG